MRTRDHDLTVDADMSSYDKVVKLACKPKAAPPKAKYLEPIIAATWSDDGAVHDVCKALSPRFREPNAIVVFKALIVLHTMIRNGATDNVLGYLSSSEVLRLRNVSAGNWEGYAAPENLQNYAIYLDSRIRAYRDLKHDAIRVQADTNRDIRNSQSIEDDSQHSRKGRLPRRPSPPSAPSRSKTITGRKLRSMTVEKGLLRETKTVHRMVDTLVECRFYLDDLEDELTTTALGMLVKDLLILFQAGNEGVINVLEHYFEMSHVDAEEALAIYRHFCKQTERVVEFLGVAKKLQNLLNVPIPNLKHAPVSLAGALQEYLDDPNFEQNRIEYRTTKDAADRSSKTPGASLKSKITENPDKPSNQSVLLSSSDSSTSAPSTSKAVVDFFSAIEEEQPTIFNPQTNSPSTASFQPQSIANPFGQMQRTGQGQIQVQPTGFIQQHMTFQPSPTNPFGLQPQPPFQNGHPPFSTFLPQQTGFAPPPSKPNFLQPQTTGGNPFRQSVLFPQTTGMAMFGVSGGIAGQSYVNGSASANPFPVSSNASSSANSWAHLPISAPVTTNAFPSSSQEPTKSLGLDVSKPTGNSSLPASAAHIASPLAHNTSMANHMPGLLARPSSTPLTSFDKTPGSISSPITQPLKAHQTGTKNPFGPIIAPAPPVPKQPTLFELSLGLGGTVMPQHTQSQQPLQQEKQIPPPPAGLEGRGFNSGALSVGATDMSSIASSFTFNKPDGSGAAASSSSVFGVLNAQNTAAMSTSATSESPSSQPTGVINVPSMPSMPSTSVSNPLQPQITGFAGLKPFKPTSSFGASLLESLPPIASTSTPATSSSNGNISVAPRSDPLPSGGAGGPLSTGSTLFSNTSAISETSVFGSAGSSVGVGLRPQMTGGGAANPFRASMAVSSFSSPSAPPMPSLPSLDLGSASFGPNLFGSGSAPFGSNQNGRQHYPSSFL